MTKILVVEDQKIIAKDIQESLLSLGYDVVHIATTGEEAIKRVEATKPDLVLMDIVLKGYITGIEAAQRIRESYDIPVVYLTAHTDEITLEKAKQTEPFGYVIKPFKDEELKTAVEMAMYKHRIESRVRRSATWLAATLKSIGDAVITTDSNARITFMNPAAERLTGWKRKEALGKGLKEIVTVKNPKKTSPFERNVTKCLSDGAIVVLANGVLITKHRKEIGITDSISPIRDENGAISGAVLIFREDMKGRQPGKEDYKAERKLSKIENEHIPITVGISSSSSLVREGMRKLLETEDDIEIIAEASSLLETLQLIGQKNPDVLFIDTSLSDLDILQIQQTINENSVDTKVLLLLHTLDEEFIMNAIYLGVQGYIKDSSNPSQIAHAIRSLKSDEIWAGRDILSKVLKRVLGTRKSNLGILMSTLTLREKEIVELIALGYSNKQISQELSISINTVKNHLANIFSKLGISNRLQIGSKI